MKKRILSVLLSLVMVVGLLPTAALAATSIPGTTGRGQSEDDPVVCDNYEEFKAAMESPYISYVKFQGKSNFYEGYEKLPYDYGNKNIGASVTGKLYTKHLIIEGFYEFYALSDYQCLLWVPSYCTLYVSGSGALKYSANSDHEQNALIYNEGICIVEGNVGLIGTYNSRVYGYAIKSAPDSKLEIKGGTFTGGAAYYENWAYAAVHAWGGAKVNISGGTFKMNIDSNELPENAMVNGLTVDETVDCTITGGTFESGIYLDSKSSLDTSHDIINHSLSDLVDENYCIIGKAGGGYTSVDSSKNKFVYNCEVLPKLKVSNVKVNGTAVTDYGNPIAGYGETTVKANEETTITAAFSTPSWIKEKNLTLKPVIFEVGPDGGSDTDVVKSASIDSGWDNVTATVSVKFTPEAGKTYTLIGALGVYASDTSDKYLAIAPAVLHMEVQAPPASLSGTVTYTGAAQVGKNLTAVVSDSGASSLSYQWQRKTSVGGAWSDISGATGASYQPTVTDYNKYVRVVVTAEGYSGSIYGAAKTVTKSAAPGAPGAPKLSVTINEGIATVTINDPVESAEYIYKVTDEAATTWPSEADGYADIEGNSFTVTQTGDDQTVRVYTRYKETPTRKAGTYLSGSTIIIPAAATSGEGDVAANKLVYPDYAGMPTVYVKKGQSTTVNYQIAPANATTNLPTWTEANPYGGSILTSVSKSENVDANGIGTITIKAGDTTGTTSVKPYKDESNEWGSGNQITVVVYDPDNASTIPFGCVSLASVELYKGDSHKISKDDLLALPFAPVAVDMSNYTLKAAILNSSTHSYSYVTENTYLTVSATEDGVLITAKDSTSSEVTVDVFAMPSGVDGYNTQYRIATLKVTVKAVPTVALESITVNPPSLTLEVGSSKTLTAIKNPINAAGDKSITWSSDTPTIATVNDSGEVSAVAEGKATITATCDGKSAECIVNVAATGHEHSYTWTKQNEYFHKGTCGCGKTALESHHWKWVVDEEATADVAGKMHEECKECKAKQNENTEIPKLTFTVTMNGIGDGASGEGNYAKGATVTINAGTKSGYTFSGWTTSDGVTFANANNAETTFTMPEKAVTVTANWTKNSSGGGGGSYTPSYTITVEDAKNGDVTVSPKSASKGATVTVTVAPDKGYDLETLTVLDKDGKEIKLTDKGNGKYTFTMPASKVTVKGTFMEDNTMLNFFVDVPADAYYYDAVLWAAENGITGGVDSVHFAPNAACTRAQAVTFLYRAAGSPAVSGGTTFSDVSAEAYYANAVAWAAANGITGGIGGGLFGSNNDCTRAQIVTFIYRCMK